MFDINYLKSKKLSEIQQISKNLGIKVKQSHKKEEIIYSILDLQAVNPAKAKEVFLATKATDIEETPKVTDLKEETPKVATVKKEATPTKNRQQPKKPQQHIKKETTSLADSSAVEAKNHTVQKSKPHAPKEQEKPNTGIEPTHSENVQLQKKPKNEIITPIKFSPKILKKSILIGIRKIYKSTKNQKTIILSKM